MTFEIVHAPHIDALATEMGEQIQSDLHAGRLGLFEPIAIVVPHANLRLLLQLRLADQLGVAGGFKFPFLETGLWELLQQHDGSGVQTKRLDGPMLARLIYSLLASGQLRGVPEMEPVWTYIGAKAEQKEWPPDAQRRAWQLCDKVARLFLEYEVQRAAMTASWRAGQLSQQPGLDPATEKWQQRLYFEIFRPGGWLESRLPNYLTLPGYRARVNLDAAPTSNAPVHWFGIAHVAPFHLDTLCELGRVRDLRAYLCVPCWADDLDANELLRIWGLSCRQTITMVEQRRQSWGLQVRASVNNADATAPQTTTMLAALQRELNSGQKIREVTQDPSLQVWACPGKHREVETVYNLILAQLAKDKELRLTDIAVLVTEIDEYLPTLREVFGRNPEIPFNLVDASAGQISLFSTAVTGLLNLVGSDFNRREVFALLSNPCCLAAIGADLDMPRQWLAWAAALGIYHSYDEASKIRESDEDAAAAGVQNADTPANADSDAPSDAHTWLAGLRRLRLGRVMAATSELPENGQLSAWAGYIPYTDLEASGAVFDRFSYGVELLHEQCAKLGPKDKPRSCKDWAAAVRQLIDACLAVPDTAGQEEPVRRKVYESLDALEQLDASFQGGVTLGFVRDHVLGALEEVPLKLGRPLLSGITITSPRPARFLPFRQIYLVGMGEGQYPGVADHSTLDLRLAGLQEGDLSDADVNRQLFLDTLLAAQDRLVLTYSNRDLEKDAELGPCSIVTQLQSYLKPKLWPAGCGFQEAVAPLSGRSRKYLVQTSNTLFDPLVNYDAHDRILALMGAENDPALSEEIRKQIVERRNAETAGVRKNVALDPPAAIDSADSSVVRLADLADFLVHPAQALLRRRLRLTDETIDEAVEVIDEPFVSGFPTNLRLTTEIQERYVQSLNNANSSATAAGFFAPFYQDAKQRSLTPDGIFARLDREHWEHLFEEMVDGPDGLRQLLDRLGRPRAVSIGAARRGAGTLSFPPLRLTTQDRTATLQGSLPFVWRQDDAIHALVLTNSNKPAQIEPDRNGRWTPIKHLLQPLLFFAALQAGTETGPEGATSQQRVDDRAFTLHLSSPKGIYSATFAVNADVASAYLAELSEAYLSAGTFDDLPLAAITRDKQLWPVGAIADDASYAGRLQENIDDAQATEHNRDFERMELLGLITDLRVPDDARLKVARRLMPLYQWRVLEGQ